MYGVVPRQLFSAAHPSPDTLPAGKNPQYFKPVKMSESVSGVSWADFVFFPFIVDKEDSSVTARNCVNLPRIGSTITYLDDRFYCVPANTVLLKDCEYWSTSYLINLKQYMINYCQLYRF